MTSLVAADLDGSNLSVDVVGVVDGRPVLWKNQLEGRFAPEPATAATWPAAERVLLDDFNNSGLPDAACVTAGRCAIAYSPAETWGADLPLESLTACGAIDYDNDGRLDIWAAGVREGKTQFAIASPGAAATTVATLEDARDALAFDADQDGDTDLLCVTNTGAVTLLQNQTQGVGRQLKLGLRSYVGVPSSIGVRVTARRGDFVASRWTHSQQPIELGLGPHQQLDSLQSLWTNGVIKNEIEVEVPAGPLRVSVLDWVRTSSCPFLYAVVDGGEVFVNDLLGAAPLNVAAARGVTMPIDPDELVELSRLDAGEASPTQIETLITCELREAVIVDAAKLVAVSHAPDVTVFPADRLAQTPTQGIGLLAGARPRTALSVTGDDGVDRTQALAHRDDTFAPPSPALHPPLVGHRQPLALEFDFGTLDLEQPYVLALTGWFRFGSSSTNIAAAQREGLQVVWPRLEALSGGEWVTIDDQVGFPAGNTKTIACDLAGKLPPETTRLRLTTSFEVRWDHVALYERVPPETLRVEALPAHSGTVQWRGFARLAPPGPDRPQEPDPSQMASRPPWMTSVEGWCTRLGDATLLVQQVDSRSVVLGPGDALKNRVHTPQPSRRLRAHAAVLCPRLDQGGGPQRRGSHAHRTLPGQQRAARQRRPGLAA